jgi:cell division protein FtsL
MMVSSPLHRQKVKPNLRKVNSTDSIPSPSQKTSKKFGQRTGMKLSAFKPTKIIIFTLVAAIFGFIYLTHVFATQELLGQVQQLQRENEQTQQVHDELKLRYDRMIGPANIYRKARELGFINAGPADQILEGQ